jgi:hypothetical protein
LLTQSRYKSQEKVEDQGPRDPITGLFTSVHGTVGGIVQGLVDYPVEISKIVQADGDVAKGLATDFALDSNKGVSRIIGTGLRAPMDFTMNLSRGFGNVPKLYGDDTVRPVEKVDGVVSGLEAAGKVRRLCLSLLVFDFKFVLVSTSKCRWPYTVLKCRFALDTTGSHYIASWSCLAQFQCLKKSTILV